MVWMTQAALAFGETAVASRWADAAVSASGGAWLATALSARASVRVAQRECAQAANDVYEALTSAGETGAHLATPDTLQCLAGLVFDAASNSEAARLLGAAHAIRQCLGLVRFKVFDDGHRALVEALRHAMGDERVQLAQEAARHP